MAPGDRIRVNNYSSIGCLFESLSSVSSLGVKSVVAMVATMMDTSGKMMTRLSLVNIMRLSKMKLECVSEQILQLMSSEHANVDHMFLKTLNLKEPPSLNSMSYVRERVLS